MQFRDIKAQDPAIQTLKRALASDKVPHAYIFTGPAGVGKALTAMAMATALNCVDHTDEGCGVCTSCQKISRGVHPDVFTFSLPENKKNIPVAAVRELESRLAVRPHEGRAKVAIIDPADMMTESAANALLKTLEEPGAGRFLILITSRLSSLLPTVRSRCQLVRFNALPDAIIEALLTENGVPRNQAAPAAAFAAGSLDRATAFLEEGLENRIDALLTLIECTVEQTPLRGLDAIEGLKRGKSKVREEALSLIDLAPIVLDELLKMLTSDSIAEGSNGVLTQLLGNRLSAVAQKLTIPRITAIAFALNNARQAILNNNMNPQLALEGVLMSTRGRLGVTLAAASD